MTSGGEEILPCDGEVGRGGAPITNDQYIIEFNGWEQAKGGE